MDTHDPDALSDNVTDDSQVSGSSSARGLDKRSHRGPRSLHTWDRSATDLTPLFGASIALNQQGTLFVSAEGANMGFAQVVTINVQVSLEVQIYLHRSWANMVIRGCFNALKASPRCEFVPSRKVITSEDE